MLQVQRRRVDSGFLEVTQHPIEQFGMASVGRGGPMEVHQFASNPEPRQDGNDLRGTDPFPGVVQFAA